MGLANSEKAIALVDYEAVCAAGNGVPEIRKAIYQHQSGLRPNDFPNTDLKTWIGRIPVLDAYEWPERDRDWCSRNNALLDLALHQGSLLDSLDRLKGRFGIARIGLVLGSSTASIDRSEEGYRHLVDEQFGQAYGYDFVLNPNSPALYVSHKLGLKGPSMTINTACSSSAKVFATASRWLQSGLVDAVLVGGGDTLCLSVLYGFNSLQLVSEQPCRPFDAHRNGINLGEAAGFALLVRDSEVDQQLDVILAGYGESSDAYHMSHPHPQGLGARKAIEQALVRAGLTSADIDYINLHGTASRTNDAVEGHLMADMFGSNVYMSSTKGWTGHTLGAAGMIEAILSVEAIRTGVVPGTLNLDQVDPAFEQLSLTSENQLASLQHVLSNSFGFGGNNASLIFSRI